MAERKSTKELRKEAEVHLREGVVALCAAFNATQSETRAWRFEAGVKDEAIDQLGRLIRLFHGSPILENRQQSPRHQDSDFDFFLHRLTAQHSDGSFVFNRLTASRSRRTSRKNRG